jgi:hypothetical protein
MPSFIGFHPFMTSKVVAGARGLALATSLPPSGLGVVG